MSLCEINKIVNEFNIPVPWGYIAVKAWGNAKNPHVLMVHGTGDNAGTFDNLIPYLPNTFYYVCIDLPGHGQSSHFPPYLPIHSINYLIACKVVTDYFKRRFIFIGHSLGGQIGYLFCRVYPDVVEKLISLDALPFFPIDPDKAIKYVKSIFEKNINLQQKLCNEEPRSYSYNEILEITCKNRYHGEILIKEAAEPLLKRCLKPTGNGKYTLTTDERLLMPFTPLHDARYSINSFKNDPIPCPMVLLIAKKNRYPLEKYKIMLDFVKKAKGVKVVYVEGRHDIHNNDPKVVAPHITQFLVTQPSKL